MTTEAKQDDWDRIMVAEHVRADAEKRAQPRWVDRVRADPEMLALLASLPIGWAETLEEWQVCQQLLDDLGIDPGRGAQMGSNLDSRVARWVNPAFARLGRIAEAHCKQIDEHGGTDGMCSECNWHWPCPTYVWATTDRDSLMCWDPSDDSEASR